MCPNMDRRQCFMTLQQHGLIERHRLSLSSNIPLRHGELFVICGVLETHVGRLGPRSMYQQYTYTWKTVFYKYEIPDFTDDIWRNHACRLASIFTVVTRSVRTPDISSFSSISSVSVTDYFIYRYYIDMQRNQR